MSSEFEESCDALQRELQSAVTSGEPPASGQNPGRLQPGNVAALRHGGRSVRVAAGLMPEQAEARAALADRVATIVNSLGGADALSPLAIDMVDRHTHLEL